MQGARLKLPLLALALAAALAGCGGGDDGGSTSSSAATEAQSTDGSTPSQPQSGQQSEDGKGQGSGRGSSKPGSPGSDSNSGSSAGGGIPKTPPAHKDSGGGSDQFLTDSSDNSIQEFGDEADDSEREDASRVLHAYLDAGVAQDQAAACSQLSEHFKQQMALLVGGKIASKGCTAALTLLQTNISPTAFLKAAEADVGSLRIEGDRGFLLYHGTGDLSYLMPMVNEGGVWKVDALTGSVIY